MTEFIVHSIPGSPFGRAVFATLEEKGASYSLKRVPMRTPEHLALHPFARIPILQHGDFHLYETQAILRYLDRVLLRPPLSPNDAKAAARMDQLLNVSDWYLFQGVGNVIGFQRVVGPRLMGLTPDEAVIEAAMPRARQVFDLLARELGERRYFTGEAVTLADILLACHVDFFRELPEWAPLAGPHRNLVAWLERMNARPSLIATTWERVDALDKVAAE
ncbi:MAG TPA: glutathione S-transferase family protein [Caulobacteraceae bacterium]|nr:glutathione S-transferase family protein [Caulobacteraceae bacterium]